jgi:hypothetical protein
MVPPDVVTLACVNDTEDDDSDTVDGWLRLVEGVATKSHKELIERKQTSWILFNFFTVNNCSDVSEFEVFTCSGEFAFAALSFLSNVFQTFLDVTLEES